MFLNKKTPLIVTLSMLLTVSGLAQAQEGTTGRGLQVAIKTALEKNPKIKSNDKILEAMALRVDAAKAAKLPSLSAGYDVIVDQGKSYNSSRDRKSDYKTAYRNASVSLNWNLFDGGARNNQIKTLECNFKEQQANFNSTNTLIRNTQGQVATLVVQYYLALSRTQQNMAFTEQALAMLAKVRTAAKTQGEIDETDNYFNSMTLDHKQFEAGAVSSANNYQYVVTEPAPAKIDTYQEMIDSLKVPASIDEALKIGLEKSPEIKRARYQVECLEYNYKTEKALAYSPRVDLSAGRNFSNRTTDRTDGSFSSINGSSVGISVRMTLDPSSSSSLKAASKETEAAQDNLDGTIADTKHDVETYYPDLANALSLSESYKTNFLLSQANMLKYMQAIDSHKKIAVTDALKEMRNLENNWYSYQQQTALVLNTKFQIQKTIGILFESLGLETSNGVSRTMLQ